MMYEPHQGDIVVVDFDPQAGHEQAGRRPALVVSNDTFNCASNVTWVCPISHTDNKFPMHVPLEDVNQTTGFVLCEHLKSLDLSKRKPSFKEIISASVLEDVLNRLRLVF